MMSNNVLLDLDLEGLRDNFLKYTRKAFASLPDLGKPNILDIGCGSGSPTIELAKLSRGDILGVDIDQTALNELKKKIEKGGFAERIRIINASLLKLDLPNESFDLIWAEGVINEIGHKKGFKECYRLLKRNGFLVLHHDIKMMKRQLKKLPSYGFKLISTIPLPEDAWWDEYYKTLEIRITKLFNKYKNNPEAEKILESQQKEVNMVKPNPKAFASAFYILQKKGD